jgi:hypothetical protein
MGWRTEWLKRASPEAVEEYRAKARKRTKDWVLANPEKAKAYKRDPIKARARRAAWKARNKGHRSPGELAKAAAKREETKRKRAANKILAYQRRLARNKVWQTVNQDRYAAYKAQWYEANKGKLQEQAKARAPATNANNRRRRATEPEFAIMNRLRCRMRKALNACGAKRTQSVIALVGCSPASFRQHIESQFIQGMTWNNRAEWHLDHKLPCASFDLTDPAQQLECFHYSNIQPLWGRENQRKSAKVLPEFRSNSDGLPPPVLRLSRHSERPT